MFLGDLVESKRFQGIGKIIGLLPDSDLAVVGFFESPLRPATNQVEVKIKTLVKSSLCEEAVVYCRNPETMLWSRGRYLGERLHERKHLIAFRRGENALVSTEDLYYINLGGNHTLNPAEFLAAKSNDAPFFFPLREDFVTSYLEQRAACRSISSLPSSSVELEQHQLAVVRRVLQDPVPKYLLADEVGLGKTIEAGLIIREHILERQRAARVIIAVPQNLISQWHQELKDRFFLAIFLKMVIGKEPRLRFVPTKTYYLK
jgi:ATP-dependent helicase HepA